MDLGWALGSCIGLTFILKYGSILSWPRNFLCSISPFLKELFNCSLCLGFWSGAALALWCYHYNWSDHLMMLPFVSAGASWFADGLLRSIQTIEIALDKYIDKK